jgi:ring-1,2-phenylacetyl-CoA epoxidase subunit PaaD
VVNPAVDLPAARTHSAATPTAAPAAAASPAPAAAPASRIAQAWAVLESVLDPEVPVLSVLDLGLVRDIVEIDAGLEVVVTPTYSGCPATEVIDQSIVAAIEGAGLGPVRVRLRRAPAWTTDWISEAGRRKLREYGIAPPGPVDSSHGTPIRFARPAPLALACPRCESTNTERLAAFGATACKALWRCRACGEPFEHFKPL